MGVAVPGMREEFTARGGLDDPPGVHHVHLVAQPGHDPQVMGDHDHRCARVGDQFLSNSRTWAWMVTSSAVVGSSQISSLGLQARAIAISARCRIPPES